MTQLLKGMHQIYVYKQGLKDSPDLSIVLLDVQRKKERKTENVFYSILNPITSLKISCSHLLEGSNFTSVGT